MKEVNSLSQEDAEEQHKKNGNKEILAVTKSRVAAKTCCRPLKAVFFLLFIIIIIFYFFIFLFRA